MQLQNFFAQDVNGNIVPGAACTLFLAGTTTLATGLQDASGNPLSNPFAANSNGLASVAAPQGLYDLQMISGLLNNKIQIQFIDAAQVAADAAAATAAANNSANSATAAQASAAQAVTLLGQFISPKATAPTVRDNGQPLQIGDSYLNTTDQLQYIYRSAGWVANLNAQALALPTASASIGAVLPDATNGTSQGALNAVYARVKVVDDYKLAIDPDDTNALQRAMDSGQPVNLLARVYTVSAQLNYNSGLTITGKGMGKSIIRANSSRFNMFFPNGPFGTSTAPLPTEVTDIRFSNLTIDQNQYDPAQFNEGIMTLVCIAVKRLVLDHVEFLNPYGDCVLISKRYGPYFSSIQPAGIKITNCKFSGTNINRNAISVISGVNGIISGCTFIKMTKQGMPCPIDFEPDSLTENIHGWVINGNLFDGCKGGVNTYITGANLSQRFNITGITITGNVFRNAFTTTTPTTMWQACMAIYNASNVSITGNTCESPADFGVIVANSGAIVMTGNSFYDCRTVGAYLVDSSGMTVTDNTFGFDYDTYNGSATVGIKCETLPGSTSNFGLKDSIIANNIIANSSTPSQSVGMFLRGGTERLTITNNRIRGWSRGIYYELQGSIYPKTLSVTGDLNGNTIPLGAALGGTSTPDNGLFQAGKNISFGVASFSAATTRVITGLHVYPTSILSVSRQGSVGAANNLSIACPTAGQLTITSTASESGSFLWEIISP